LEKKKEKREKKKKKKKKGREERNECVPNEWKPQYYWNKNYLEFYFQMKIRFSVFFFFFFYARHRDSARIARALF